MSNHTSNSKQINVYRTPAGNRRYCIEDAATAYGNNAELLGPAGRGETCETCGAASSGNGTSSRLRIRAEAHSDDRVYEADFDAARYFEQAPDDDLLKLARCGFGGDYPADAVAHFMAEHDEAVAAIFDYLEHRNAGRGKNLLGFECHVDKTDGLTWLKEHRADIFPDIEAIVGNDDLV